MKGKLQNQKETDHLNNNPSLQKNHNFIPKERKNNESTDSVQKNANRTVLIVLLLAIGRAHATDLPPAPVAYWSTEARKAIVPPSAGAENYGNKFPGEAALYMGIVHVAIYDAAVAIEGGYEFYAQYDPPLVAPPNTSSEAAIATAAHHTLVGPPGTGLQPALGLTQAQVDYLNGIYNTYMANIPDGEAKTNGRTIGERVAAAIVTLRQNDGREQTHHSTRRRQDPVSGNEIPATLRRQSWVFACR